METKFSLWIILLLSIISVSCNDKTTEPAKDTEKPTVTILYPANGSDVKADTIYTVIADANDNTKVTSVEFYISGVKADSDSLSPYEFIWSTLSLTGSQTIMAKAYDEAGNIGTSAVITATIKGVANHPPTIPSSPSPADSALGQFLNPMLIWSCTDPDGDAITYDVFLDSSNPPTTQIATKHRAATLSYTGLSSNTTYFWKVNAKDSKGATTTGTVWRFTTVTNNPPATPSNPTPADADTSVSTSITMSWICTDPDNDSLVYDVYFGTSNPPTTQLAAGRIAMNLWKSGLSLSTRYYWRVIAKDKRGASTTGPIWSFNTWSGLIAQSLLPVAGGTFAVGSTQVAINAFKMARCEVTYELWAEVRSWASTHGYLELPDGNRGYNGTSNHPVTKVNWYDVIKWCNARSEKEGLTPVYYTRSAQDTIYRTGQIDINVDAVNWTANGYRLPTEAEWEFAARGGNLSHGYQYSGSDIIGDVAWYQGNSFTSTHTIAQLAPNELGLYDMCGNVWEWCWDWWGSVYPSGGTTNPKGPSMTQLARVIRGGSFGLSESYCRVNSRGNGSNLINRNDNFGFRCVRN
jgi:formylglycine-generating enzyme required for sulfatase activity